MQNPPSQEELENLTARLNEAEETLRAIYQRDVDALVVQGPEGDQIFTLQGAERPYRILVESMNEGALTLIPDGTILFCNSRLAELIERPLEQVTGSDWRELFPLEERELLAAILKDLGRGGTRNKGEFTLVGTGGRRTPVQLSARPLQFDDFAAIAVIVTDISERKDAEEALRQANEELKARASRLEEVVSELEAFSYTISHDLRAPLRSIQSFSKILLADFSERLEPEALDYLQRVGGAADRLDRLVLDLLTYSRTAREELMINRIDLNRLTREVIEHHASAYPDASIEIEGKLPGVWAHEASLSQCLSNLIGNALKFVEPGKSPRVRIWAEPRGGQVRIWIEDNGIGLLPQDQGRIFRIFERVHSPGAYAGTGIGLSIVKKAVERMGGSVGVESQPGQGSRFWIQLDAKKPE